VLLSRGMLDLRALEADPNAFATNLRRRGDVPNLDEVLQLAVQRKEAIQQAQKQQEEKNRINDAMKKATPEEREARRAELRELSDRIKQLEDKQREAEARLEELALLIPNSPRADVPHGTGSDDNVEVRKVLAPRAFTFAAKDHVDIGQHLGMLDAERAAKVSGARFTFMMGAAAKLERALASFMLDFHLQRGDLEVAPPLLVSFNSMKGTGNFPKFTEDAFAVSSGLPQVAGPTPLYLIPTAEVPVTNYYADEIIDESELPKRFCAYSPCFRAEAGSAGRDTRGLIRQHQFTKVEMVRFCKPEDADAELEAMVQRASDIMTALELPHRVMLLCTGDMGFSSERTYDLEVWLPGQNMYREISSCSTCGSFQARRAGIRYRPQSADPKKAAKPVPLVTLNGSGLAVGRTLIAILENHQQEDGSVRIPNALQPYMGTDRIVPRA
jgi:seryl-tRNA synthetase